MYSEEEVERLSLLARATELGHKISIIAPLKLEDLRRLVAAVSVSPPGMHGTAPRSPEAEGVAWEVRPQGGVGNGVGPEPERVGEAGGVGLHGAGEGSGASEPGDARLVQEALEATRAFRSDSLQRVLERGTVRMGHNGVLRRLICPLANEIGELWQRGEVTAAHEHFASVVIRDFLMRIARPYAVEEGAPRMIVTTPAGQLHELGAVMVAAAAANQGWHPVYLGPSLPPAEIAGAALQNGARAVLLSIVYPADDRWLPRDLIQLRKLLPATVKIVVGGRAAGGYAAVLKEIGAISPDGMEAFCEVLKAIRAAGTPQEGVGPDGTRATRSVEAPG